MGLQLAKQRSGFEPRLVVINPMLPFTEAATDQISNQKSKKAVVMEAFSYAFLGIWRYA